MTDTRVVLGLKEEKVDGDSFFKVLSRTTPGLVLETLQLSTTSTYTASSSMNLLGFNASSLRYVRDETAAFCSFNPLPIRGQLWTYGSSKHN